MPLLGSSRPAARPVVRTLGPIGGLLAAVAIVPIVLIGLVTLLLAVLLTPGARRNVRVWRFGHDEAASGRPDPDDAVEADVVGTGAPGTGPAAGAEAATRKAPESYAEIVEAWPFVLALGLLAGLLVPGVSQ